MVQDMRCLVSFPSALDAVRFCHGAQVALLFQRWPSDCGPICGETLLAADGRLLFAGPRLAMAVHTTPVDGQPTLLTPRVEAGVGGKGRDAESLDDGSEEAFAERLAEVAYGGQVVLSETSWSAIQDQLPGQSQACPLS